MLKGTKKCERDYNCGKNMECLSKLKINFSTIFMENILLYS